MANGLSIVKATGPLHGVGLFCGQASGVSFASGDGLSFVRMEQGQSVGGVAAQVAWVSASAAWAGLPAGVPVRNTTLSIEWPGREAMVAATVEHVLSACAGLGVWNASVCLEGGPELPILDGSALPFVEAIQAASGPGTARRPVVLREAVEVVAGDAFIRGEPYDGIEYTYSLDYGAGAPIAPQRATWRGWAADYVERIAPARTFSLLREAQAARGAGLFKHLTAREMLVIGDDGRPIDNEWRFEDEPAKHKLLDLIGDLALLGGPLHAKVTAHKAGHALTHEFCRKILTTEGHGEPRRG